jgi:uncharacterized protein YraI
MRLWPRVSLPLRRSASARWGAPFRLRGGPYAVFVVALLAVCAGVLVRGGTAARLQAGPDLALTITHIGVPFGPDFEVGSTTGLVITDIANIGTADSGFPITVTITLANGLTRGTTLSQPFGLFTCTGFTTVTCVSGNTAPTGSLQAGNIETIRFNVNAPALPSAAPGVNVASVVSTPDVNPINDFATDPVPFSIVQAATVPPSATATLTPSPTASPSPTLPFLPTLPPIVTPTVLPTATRTFIPPLPTRTPLPRPANAGQAIPIPPSGVSVVTNRDGVNVRITPAIGAEVIAFVNAGTLFENVSARSGDGEWVRVKVGGQEGWVGFPVITVLSGDVNALPVGDPRTIPYGGFESPRAGITTATSAVSGRLALSGLRIRSGPGLGYVVLANAPRYTVFPVLGRTAENTWVQVNFEGTLGWVAAEFVEFGQGLGVLAGLPIDGIIAEGLPVSAPTQDSYADTLTLLRARAVIALDSLNRARDVWTRVSLGEPFQCGDYPARPTDFNIPNPVLAAFNGTLDPVQREFNQAMELIRQAIDGLVSSCNTDQPPRGFVGAGAASLALEALNRADSILTALIPQLDALIPVDAVPAEGQCVFSYQGENELVTRLISGRAVLVEISDDEYILGFCFDGTQGETYRLEGLIVPESNANVRITVSAFSNPTAFIAAGDLRPGEGNATGGAGYTALSNILIPETGQYLVLLSDLNWEDRTGPLEGDIALLLLNTTGATGELALGLAFNPVTREIVVNPNIDIVLQVPQAGTPGFVGTGVQPTVGFGATATPTRETAQ